MAGKVTTKRRLRCLAAVAASVACCAAIVRYFPGHAVIRGFLGDVFVVPLGYFLLQAMRRFRPLALGAGLLAVAVVVELLQYLRVSRLVGLDDDPVVRLVFGAVFDVADLLAYATGAVLVIALEYAVRAVSRRRATR